MCVCVSFNIKIPLTLILYAEQSYTYSNDAPTPDSTHIYFIQRRNYFNSFPHPFVAIPTEKYTLSKH